MTMPLSTRAKTLLGSPPQAAPREAETMPAAATSAVIDALDRGETHYTDRPGIMPLRKRVAALLTARFKTPFEAANLTISCGLTEARFVAVQQLLQDNAHVAAPADGGTIAGALTVRGAHASTHLVSVDMLYVAASAGSAAITEWLAQVSRQCIVVFEVDRPGDTFHPAQVDGFSDRVVTIGELGLGDGLASARLGYIAAPATQAASLRDFKQALTICSTNLSQWAALAVVEDL